MKDIATQIKASGFKGVTVIASNPVDVLTTVYQKVTGFNPNSIVGSGTTLDSARLRRLTAEKLGGCTTIS
jgi:L-lactate dehydrogenase